MRMRHTIGFAAPLAAGLLLAGCALLGGGKPEQLYRFGDSLPAAAADAGVVVPAARYTVLLMPVRFAAEIESDRVLASRGAETLYIKGLRWVAPAPVLFGQSLRAGFRARAPWIAVTDRRAGGAPDDILQIRVDRFEARYQGAAKSPPTIHLEGEATLSDARTHGTVGSYRLVAERQAGGSNAAAIVAAFDLATATAIAETVDWAGRTAARPRGERPG